MTRRPYRIALAQYAVDGPPPAMAHKAADLVLRAAAQGAAVICLPELCTLPYFCKSHDAAWFDRAEPLDGPTVGRLAAAARQAGVTVIVPFFERRAAGLYHNTAAVLGPDGRVLAVYRKMHIPEDPGFHEKYYFTPGDTGFLAVDTPVGRVGVCICWDQWFPEAARLTALAGAEVIFYPTAIAGLSGESETEVAEMRQAWSLVQRGHAVANGCYVAAANRVGGEAAPDGRQSHFWGASFVAGPMGELVAEAGHGEELLLAEINPGRLEEVRRTWPFLRDRRVDAYAGIGEVCRG